MARKAKISNTNSEAEARKDTYEWIQCLVAALIICVFLFLFFVRIIDVKGTSM